MDSNVSVTFKTFAPNMIFEMNVFLDVKAQGHSLKQEMKCMPFGGKSYPSMTTRRHFEPLKVFS